MHAPKFIFGRPQIRISQPCKTTVNLRKTAVNLHKTAVNSRKTAVNPRKDAGISALLMEAQAEVTQIKQFHGICAAGFPASLQKPQKRAAL